MTDELKPMVSDLSARLQRVEDELAIHHLIVRYGFAVDCGDADAAMSCFTEEAVYHVSAVRSGLDDELSDELNYEKHKPLIMKGRQEIGKMVLGQLHQSLLPHCAHTMGPVLIELDGNRAQASGYSRVYLRQADENNLFRLATNHWQLKKIGDDWFIDQRRSEVLGTQAAQSLLATAMKQV